MTKDTLHDIFKDIWGVLGSQNVLGLIKWNIHLWLNKQR